MHIAGLRETSQGHDAGGMWGIQSSNQLQSQYISKGPLTLGNMAPEYVDSGNIEDMALGDAALGPWLQASAL